MGKRKKYACDAAIVGGGLAGLTLSAILCNHGLQVVCIDREDPQKTLESDFDGRTTAISWGSRQVLEAAGIWNDLLEYGCPIEDIHILDDGSAVLLEFLAKDVGEDAFGWIFENLTLRKALLKSLAKKESFTHLAPAQIENFEIYNDSATTILNNQTRIESQLIIGADGRNSFVREWSNIPARQWSYNQNAIVCIATHENPHNNIAIEDFRSEGPFAVLPMNDDEKGNHRSSIVWSEHGRGNDSALSWDEDVFNAALTSRFPEFYGEAKLSGKRFSYPLGLVHAQTYIADRMCLVADAAHGIHPIAGQGLNLGYRDIASLSELLVNAKKQNEDLGSERLLKNYQQSRRLDNVAMAGTTDVLNRVFSNNFKPLRILRKIGLRSVQKFSPARKFFMRQAMGATGILPSLIEQKRS